MKKVDPRVLCEKLGGKWDESEDRCVIARRLACFKRVEVAKALGVSPVAISQRVKRGSLKGFEPCFVGRGPRRFSEYSLLYLCADSESKKVLDYFYKIGLDRYMSFTTFRDLFNELVDRGYDLKRFLDDYDEEDVLSLLGYDVENIDYRGKWAHLIPFRKKLYACLLYAFAHVNPISEG